MLPGVARADAVEDGANVLLAEVAHHDGAPWAGAKLFHDWPARALRILCEAVRRRRRPIFRELVVGDELIEAPGHCAVGADLARGDHAASGEGEAIARREFLAAIKASAMRLRPGFRR